MRKLLVILSSIAYFVLISSMGIRGVAIGAVLGLGIGCFLSGLNAYPGTKKWVRILCAVLAAAIAALSFRSYLLNWEMSENLEALTSRLSLDKSLFIRLSGGVLAILSLIFLYFLLLALAGFLSDVTGSMDWREIGRQLLRRPGHGFFPRFLSIVGIVLLSAALGIALLTAVWSIHSDSVLAHMTETAKIFDREGAFEERFAWCMSIPDSSTDAIILLEASEESGDTAFRSALLSYHSLAESQTSMGSIIVHFLYGDPYAEQVTYAKYWHGYLVPVRLLLVLTDYRGIRIVNGICQLILELLVILLLFRRGKKEFVLPYALVSLMLMPVVMAESIQYSTCFYVFTVASLLILFAGKKAESRIWLIFLMSGICLAYFDFLTYPAASFGIPAVFWLITTGRKSAEEQIGALVRYGACWGAGYGLMWAFKWFLASAFTEQNVIAEALRSLAERTSSVQNEGLRITMLATQMKNIEAFLFTPVSILFVIYLVYYGKSAFRRLRAGELSRKEFIRTVLPYLAVALTVPAWYAFAENHSYIHYFYSNKACVVIVFAMLCAARRAGAEGEKDGT